MSLDSFNLTVETAGGNTLPYLGYIECRIKVPYIRELESEVPVLVVPTTEYGLTVPVVVGTNAIKLCKAVAENGAENIPTVWQNAFISLQQSHLGVVKSTNKTDIQIQPTETVTLSGFVRKKRSVETAVTEKQMELQAELPFVPGLSR